jgi:hypothetical protein
LSFGLAAVVLVLLASLIFDRFGVAPKVKAGKTSAQPLGEEAPHRAPTLNLLWFPSRRSLISSPFCWQS